MYTVFFFTGNAGNPASTAVNGSEISTKKKNVYLYVYGGNSLLFRMIYRCSFGRELSCI